MAPGSFTHLQNPEIFLGVVDKRLHDRFQLNMSTFCTRYLIWDNY